MDSFSILCTTCKTRLKVRDEGAVGKILACPKCGGMVMVKPPAQWEAAADEQGSTRTAIPNSASGTLPMSLLSSPSAFDDVDDLLAGRTPPPAAPAPPTSPTAAAPAATQVLNKSPVAKPQATPATSPATKEAPPTGEGAKVVPSAPAAESAARSEAETAPPNFDEPMRPDWDTNQPWRYWFSLTCAGLAGTLLALVVVLVTIRMFQRRPALAEVSAATITPASNSEASPADPVAETASEASASPAVPEEPNPPPPSSDRPSSQDQASEDPPSPAEPSLPPKSIRPAETAAPSEPPAANDALATLSKVGKLLGESKPEMEPALDEKPVPLPTDSDPSPAAAPTALPRPEPRSIDVAARLADKVPEIKADGIPLSDFLQFLLEFTTAPITLEPESLIWVRATPSSPVAIHVVNQSVGEVLKAALAPLKLEAQVAEDQIVVTLPAKLVTIPYPTGDLTGEDPERIAALTELVRQNIEPESWKSADGPQLVEKKNTLEVTHNPSVQLQVLTLMEKLRVARGLATRSKFEPALFRIATRYERARSKLDKPISCNFSQPTSLIRILQQLSETGAMGILIDWRSLLREGWTPDSIATLVVEKRPLETALGELLTPMDLAFRVVDEQTIQVVSSRDLQDRVDLELYPAGDLLEEGSADALETKIRAALGDDLFREAGGKSSLAFDGPSKHLVAVLPQPQQRALAALLEAWRKEGK